jgi:hypothetical protein
MVFDPLNKVGASLLADPMTGEFVPAGTCFTADWHADSQQWEIDDFAACCPQGSGSEGSEGSEGSAGSGGQMCVSGAIGRSASANGEYHEIPKVFGNPCWYYNGWWVYTAGGVMYCSNRDPNVLPPGENGVPSSQASYWYSSNGGATWTQGAYVEGNISWGPCRGSASSESGSGCITWPYGWPEPPNDGNQYVPSYQNGCLVWMPVENCNETYASGSGI